MFVIYKCCCRKLPWFSSFDLDGSSVFVSVSCTALRFKVALAGLIGAGTIIVADARLA